MVSKKILDHSSKKDYPLVSVIMPAYNAEKYIGKAIESILQQTFVNFELIIIDDFSTDNTYDLITKYRKKDKRIIILRNGRNLKLSKTLNKGILYAKGKYIARMDADDWSYKYRLEKQYTFLEEHKDVGIVGGAMKIVNEKDHIIGLRTYHETDSAIRNNIFWYSPFCHPVIMIRKSILNRAGNYKDEYNPAEDYELYFRLGKYSRFANLHDVLLKYRVVGKSMTTGSTRNMEKQTIRIRQKYGGMKNYNQSFLQKIYNWLHLLSLYIIPS
jgi:glycosyltransferase involved in cell wall biosynthesis